MIDDEKIKVVQDMDLAITVMRDCGKWLQDSGKNPNKWWQLQNLNRKFLLKHTKPEEYYAFLVEDAPASSEILQTYADDPGWQIIDGGQPQRAVYVHWFSVTRAFAGQGLSERMITFAEEKAKEWGYPQLRLETNAAEPKLRALYEKLGFTLVTELQQEYRRSAFYHKKVTL